MLSSVRIGQKDFEMGEQKKPYYFANEDYEVIKTTEIGFVRHDGYWLYVAYIQDIKFKKEIDAKIIRTGLKDLLVKKDLSQDSVILYECEALIDFPASMNTDKDEAPIVFDVVKNTEFFAVSKNTGVFEDFTESDGKLKDKWVGGVRIADFKNLSQEELIKAFEAGLEKYAYESGYIRELTGQDGIAPLGMTSIGKGKNGNMRQNLGREIKSFAGNIMHIVKNGRTLNRSHNFYKGIIKQLNVNHSKFKQGK